MHFGRAAYLKENMYYSYNINPLYVYKNFFVFAT